MSEQEVPEQVWQMIKEHLGYSGEELELFKSRPGNARVMAVAGELQQKTIVFEVVESAGCNSQHKVGTKFYFSGDGNLITSKAPARTCAYALPAMTQAIFAIQELIYAGVDPNQMAFNHASCFDVGVKCGGWGKIVVEASVVDRAAVK